MGLLTNRWIQALQSTPTSIFNTLLASGDTLATLYSKIQGLIQQKALHASLTSPLSITSGNAITLTVPANVVVAGDTFRCRIAGNLTKPFSSGSTITFTVNVNGIGVSTISFQPTGALSVVYFYVDWEMVMSSVGGSGLMTAIGMGTIQTTATAFINPAAASIGSQTVITTSNFTIQVSCSMSNVNGSNNFSIYTATIEML